MSHNHQKKIAVINDFCGFGRCSIAASLPIISAMKIQCCPLPTSVFSNHTGFDSFHFTDYTQHMNPYIDEWVKLDLHFSGILTGFLGSPEQIHIVKRFLELFKEDSNITVIDPVMGDYGNLYPTYSPKLAEQMSSLVPYADILTPNLTEACLLTGIPYPSKDIGLPLSFYQKLIDVLALFGPKRVILSGQELQKGMMSEVIYDGTIRALEGTKRYPGSFHGTGDLFSSSFAGSLLNGKTFEEAVGIAHQYVSKAISITSERGGDGQRFGVDFEQAIPYLVSLLSK